jgi:mono/diheme cytochrome c family protein
MSRRRRHVTIRPVRGGGALALGLWAVFLAGGGACNQQPAANSCPPAPVDPPCPDSMPSFARDVYPNVFALACVRCHSPTGEEPKTPLTNYQQIYGTDGAEAREIYFQVVQSCLMPPPGAPEELSDVQRQTLLDWFGCGAPDTP